MSTELVTRERTFDLTRSPDEQWNEEMLKLVAATVLKGSATRSEQYYCLAVADSLNLNPFVDEIYFIKVKSRDGGGKVLKPYIGRNGLVAKATERGAYYQAAEVHENDVFEVETTTTGRTKLHHKYGHKDRGAIVGAYAFLHGPWKIPGFAYIDIEEYLPTFDEKWKEDASPWYNQRAAMAKKCAMIVAGRERLQLGNVLADGEIDRVQQQMAAGAPETPQEETEFDWGSVSAPQEMVERLRAAVEVANTIEALTWTPAKLQMLVPGLDEQAIVALAERIERENAAAGRADVPEAEPEEEVVDAQPLTDEESARVEVLQNRIAKLKERLDDGPWDEREQAELQEEMDQLGAELAAIGNPDQGSLL